MKRIEKMIKKQQVTPSGKALTKATDLMCKISCLNHKIEMNEIRMSRLQEDIDMKKEMLEDTLKRTLKFKNELKNKLTCDKPNVIKELTKALEGLDSSDTKRGELKWYLGKMQYKGVWIDN